MSMQSSDPYSCVICHLPLLISSKRRLINPVTEANTDVHEFFVQYVVPGYVFSPSDSSKYVCKYPCFADVEKATKRHLLMQGILANICGKLSLHPSSPDPVAIPAPGSASSSQPVIPHLRNSRFLSVVQRMIKSFDRFIVITCIIIDMTFLIAPFSRNIYD